MRLQMGLFIDPQFYRIPTTVPVKTSIPYHAIVCVCVWKGFLINMSRFRMKYYRFTMEYADSLSVDLYESFVTVVQIANNNVQGLFS